MTYDINTIAARLNKIKDTMRQEKEKFWQSREKPA